MQHNHLISPRITIAIYIMEANACRMELRWGCVEKNDWSLKNLDPAIR
jgi:hypothetical protein